METGGRNRWDDTQFALRLDPLSVTYLLTPCVVVFFVLVMFVGQLFLWIFLGFSAVVLANLFESA